MGYRLLLRRTDAVQQSAGISQSNKNTALANYSALFAPFLPPYSGAVNVHGWRTSAFSPTNEAYFELLNDIIVKESPIFIPESGEIDDFKLKLQDLLGEIEGIGLPIWIRKDFQEAVGITLLAIDKVPFLAHRIIQDAHNTVLARLFSVASPDQRRFMVKVATTMNIIFAAFIMPHEAAEATQSYYGWVSQSPVDVKQVEACARPLALPAPDKDPA